MKRIFRIVAAVLLYSVASGSLAGAGNTADGVGQAAPDPLNTTYWIAGQPVALVDGRRASRSAPGSAIKVRTAVWRHPVFGDLDDDGDEDAALLLIHDPGGSGTFYYVAAVINASGRYRATNTILLGDRITPTDLAIGDRTVMVDYADRRPEEPLSVTPSVDRTMALVVQHGQLLATTSPREIENVTQGWVTIGHEVRSFRPCNSANDLWLMGQSPALKAIMAAYRRALPGKKGYRPLFMVLAGKQVELPAHGFDADHEAAFLATHLLRVVPGASCTNDLQDIDSVNGYMHKITFDISTLDEGGLYGPADRKRARSYEFCIPNKAPT